MAIVGVDIGGSGIKGAPVDLSAGELADERYRIETPQPSDVKAVVKTTAQVVAKFGTPERVGVTFPGVVVQGTVLTAANVDKSWVDAPAAQLFTAEIGCPVTVINDADAAGIAEMAFGVGAGHAGTVVMLTFGTGIGSAIFVDGRLLPNTEFGHLELHGKDAELRASDRARSEEDLGWHAWAKRVDEYLHHVEMLVRPDLFIIGGGVSKKSEHYLHHLTVKTPVEPAKLLNNAGIIGAAMAAAATGGAPSAQ
jgi:polyphosphate glucokinase